MSEVKQVKSIKFNFIMNVIRVLMTIVFPLITYPYASRVLHAAGMGQASYVASIVSYCQLIASFGINAYAITEGAKIRDDQKKLNKFASEMFLINLVFTAAAYLVFVALLFVPKFQGYTGLLIISSSSIICTTLGMEWLYELLEDYQFITLRSVLFQAASLVLLFLLVRTRDDVPYYVALTVLSTAGSGIMAFIHSRKIIHLFECKPEWSSVRRHIKPMLYMFGVQIASVIYLNSDITMIGIMKGDTDTGLYTAASKTNQIICTMIKSLSTVIMPRLAYYLENGHEDEFKALLQKAFRFMLLLIAPCMAGMLLVSPEVLHLIAGEEYVVAASTSRILAINLFFSPINGFIAYQIFMPQKKEKVIFWATLGGAISNFIINLILIPHFSYDGAAAATVMAEAMVMIICICLGKKMIPFKGMFRGCWKYVVSVIPMVVICYFLRMVQFPNYIVFLFVMIVLAALTYAGMLLILRDDIAREEVRAVLGKIRKR